MSAALWSDFDPIMEGAELKHDQEDLSDCCGARLLSHWPHDTRTQCSVCLRCSYCGDNFEREGIQEAERRRKR